MGRKGFASSRPNGFPTFFYHSYWETIDNNVINYVPDVLNKGVTLVLTTIPIFALFLKHNQLSLVILDLLLYALFYLKSSLKLLLPKFFFTYLFIIYADVLSNLLTKARSMGPSYMPHVVLTKIWKILKWLGILLVSRKRPLANK